MNDRALLLEIAEAAEALAQEVRLGSPPIQYRLQAALAAWHRWRQEQEGHDCPKCRYWAHRDADNRAQQAHPGRVGGPDEATYRR